MLQMKIFGISLFTFLYTFYIYSFIGWIYESSLISLRHKKWVNRGFLNGPIIPIYGFGAGFIILIFYHSRLLPLTQQVNGLHIILVYLIGMIAATVLEYITSYLMEKIFHARWWDYGKERFQFQGRICLKSSLFWGVLSLVVVYVAEPTIKHIIDSFPRPLADIILYAFVVITIVDTGLTTHVTLNLKGKLLAVEKLQELLYEYSSGLHWYDRAEQWKDKVEKSRWYEWMKVMQNNRLHHHIYKRMFQAFPKFRIQDREKLLEDFRTKLQNIRR